MEIFTGGYSIVLHVLRRDDYMCRGFLKKWLEELDLGFS